MRMLNGRCRHFFATLDPIPAETRINTGDAANYLKIILPPDLNAGFGEEGNDWQVRVQRGVSPVTGVDAIQAFARARTTNTANYTEFTLPNDLPDALTTEGDLWQMRLRRGRPAHAASVASGLVRASVLVRTSIAATGVNGLRITLAGVAPSVQGAEGNEYEIRFGQNTQQQAAVISSISAVGFIIAVQVGNAGETTLGEIKAAFDLYDSNDVSFTTAYEGTGAAGDATSFDSGDEIPFTGGTEGSVAGVDAYADWENGGNGIRITMKGHLPSSIGEDGNQWEIRSNENTLVNAIGLTVDYGAHLITFPYNTDPGATTLGDVLNAFNDFDEGELSFSVAYIGTGGTATNLSGFPHNVTVNFEGGAGTPARARQPIHGRIDAVNNRLIITYRAGDTQTDVRAAVALATYVDDFGVTQTFGTANIVIVGTVGLDFGTLHDSSIPNAGDTTDFSFSGAADEIIEVLRTPLTVPGAASVAQLISIVAIDTDTNADIVAAAATAAYSDLDGASQIFPVGSIVAVGDGTTPLGDGTNLFNRPVGNHKNFNFSGGVNPDPITAELDAAAKLLEVTYHADYDTMTEILDIIAATAATPVLIHGTDGDLLPEASPFTRAFRGAGGAGGASGGGGGGSVSSSVMATPPSFFLAPINESAGVDLSQTPANYLGITAADVIVDRGEAFVVEVGTNGLQHVKCLKAGHYSILVGMGCRRSYHRQHKVQYRI